MVTLSSLTSVSAELVFWVVKLVLPNCFLTAVCVVMLAVALLLGRHPLILRIWLRHPCSLSNFNREEVRTSTTGHHRSLASVLPLISRFQMTLANQVALSLWLRVSCHPIGRRNGNTKQLSDSPLQFFATELTNDLRSHPPLGRTLLTAQKIVGMGTPDYLAPETILGLRGDDAAVDWVSNFYIISH